MTFLALSLVISFFIAGSLHLGYRIGKRLALSRNRKHALRSVGYLADRGSFGGRCNCDMCIGYRGGYYRGE